MSTPEDPRSLGRSTSLLSGVTGQGLDTAGIRREASHSGSVRQSTSQEEERVRRWAERAKAKASAVLDATDKGSFAAADAGLPTSIPQHAPIKAKLRTETDAGAPSEPRRVLELKPLPQVGRERSLGVLISFVICVILPIIAASIYYFGYASNQYASEFSFVVRDAKSAAAATSSSGLSGMMGMLGGSPNSVENYMVAEFILSGKAVDALQKDVNLVKMYSRPDIDWLARLDPSAPIERVIPYWRRMVTATYDQITGLGVVHIRAFSPQDAYVIATSLVKLSEELVNRVANRAQLDAVRFAEEEVRRAEGRLLQVRSDLTEYRNKEMVIEPQADNVSGKIAVAQTLRSSIASLETEVTFLKGQNLSQNAPQMASLLKRLDATREQLRAVELQVPKARDGNTPLSTVVAEYESLDQSRQFAQNMVNTTMQDLEQARATARAQHIYVTAFIDPLVPQSPTYPKRVTSILLVGLGFMLFWTIGLLIVSSVREHLT